MEQVALRARVLALLRRHGRDAVAFQVLEPGLRYWFEDEACVAYAEVAGGRAWVAAGGPIAARDAEVDVMLRFAAAARAAHKRVCFFGLERDLSGSSRFALLDVGGQPIWDPRSWRETLATRRSLREQLRRARNKGVGVRLAPVDELRPGTELRRRVDLLIAHWLARRSMAPMRFVVSLEPWEYPEERRFFVAERGPAQALAGILVAVPIHARGGWLLEDVLRDPDAPNGTVELMFDTAMRTLAAEGSDHATFGLVPLAGVPSRTLRIARHVGRPFYDFEGLLRFKRKLGPQAVQRVWIAYPRGRLAATAVLDVLRAFAGDSLWRFGWRTLVHRAPDVARLLALALVPWIALLALAPVDPWFPSAAVQRAWIALDLGILLILCRLSAQWSARLATTLAIIAAADFVFGLAQALSWNFSRVSLAAESIAIVCGVVAPLGVACFTWGARRRSTLGDA